MAARVLIIILVGLTVAFAQQPPVPNNDNTTDTRTASADIQTGAEGADIEAFVPMDDSLVFGNIYSTLDDPMKLILVEKATRSVFMLEVDENGQRILARKPVITGANDGDKQIEGDEKTPEGIYFIRRHLSEQALLSTYGDYAKIYGHGSYPLSYPNIVDRIQGKTGGGIWLHGLKEDDHKPATQGCVGLENWDFDNLSDFAEVGMPVLITERAHRVEKTAYPTEQVQLATVLDRFISAWEQGDTDTYRSYFHPEFRDQHGTPANDYLASKEYLMQAIDYRKIDTDNLVIFKENGSEMMYSFDQFYCASNIVSAGTKRLYFAKQDGDFRIIAEEYRSGSAAPLINKEADSFVKSWRDSWVGMKLDSFLEHYDNSFTNGNMDIKAWREYKSRLFEKYDTITVEIGTPRIRTVSPTRYEVSFTQKFDGGTYADYGTKTLVLEGCPGDFSIVAEYWSAL